jgi:hypothetical protein
MLVDAVRGVALLAYTARDEGSHAVTDVRPTDSGSDESPSPIAEAGKTGRG